MKENIYEYIYLFFCKDQEALHSLIQLMRPTTSYIIRQKGMYYLRQDHILMDYYSLADHLLYECLLRCQTDRYQTFTAFYKRSLAHRIIDYNRMYKNHCVEANVPTLHLDQYVREYAHSLVADHQDVHKQTMAWIHWESIEEQLQRVFSKQEIRIFQLKQNGYSAAEIAETYQMSIRKVRYILTKMKKWIRAH